MMVSAYAGAIRSQVGRSRKAVSAYARAMRCPVGRQRTWCHRIGSRLKRRSTANGTQRSVPACVMSVPDIV
eukprot:245206-Rhodomonas_salina.4